MTNPVVQHLLYSDDDVSFATSDNVFLVMWHTNTTLEAVDRLRLLYSQFAARHPSKNKALLTIVETDASLPSNAAREALAQFMKDKGRAIQASGVAFEGNGFRSVAVRSVIVGLTLLAKQPFPHKIFATVDEAARWLLATLGDASEARLESVLNAAAAMRTDNRRGSPDRLAASA